MGTHVPVIYVIFLRTHNYNFIKTCRNPKVRSLATSLQTCLRTLGPTEISFASTSFIFIFSLLRFQSLICGIRNLLLRRLKYELKINEMPEEEEREDEMHFIALTLLSSSDSQSRVSFLNFIFLLS